MSLQQVSDTQIAEAAFYIWLEEGQPENRAEVHWHQARTALEKPAKPKRRAAAKTKAPAKKAAPKTAKAPAKKAAPKAAKPRKAKA